MIAPQVAAKQNQRQGEGAHERVMTAVGVLKTA